MSRFHHQEDKNVQEIYQCNIKRDFVNCIALNTLKELAAFIVNVYIMAPSKKMYELYLVLCLVKPLARKH